LVDLERRRKEIREELFRKAYQRYQAELVRVQLFNEKEFEAFLRTILKPEFKNEPITFRRSGGQLDAFCAGWLLAYKSGWIWIWRGNQCSIYSATDAEREAGRLSPEYKVYPDVKDFQ